MCHDWSNRVSVKLDYYPTTQLLRLGRLGKVRFSFKKKQFKPDWAGGWMDVGDCWMGAGSVVEIFIYFLFFIFFSLLSGGVCFTSRVWNIFFLCFFLRFHKKITISIRKFIKDHWLLLWLLWWILSVNDKAEMGLHLFQAIALFQHLPVAEYLPNFFHPHTCSYKHTYIIDLT